jgi:catechol-2,3-dioxygenase
VSTERRIRGIGEVAVRVRDLALMSSFYEGVVGLEVLRREEDYVFFRVAEGYGGHTQNLALFDAPEIDPERTTLHHVALNVSLEDFDRERARLEGLGLEVDVTQHEWIHVRSLYFRDPEGNQLELVAYDESVR